VYVLIFLAVAIAAESAFLMVQGARRANPALARKRLRRLAEGLQAPDVEGEGSILKRPGRSTFGRLLDLLPYGESLQLLLYRSGSGMTVTRFTLLSLSIAGAGWLLGTVLLVDQSRGLLLAGAGLLPLVWLASKKRRRLRQFEEHLPEALELLTRALRAGHSFSVGMQIVGDELPDPVGPEFAYVADEIAFGQDVRQALANLAYRMDSPDLPFFVTAVLLQRETGGNLAEILENLGHVIRERLKTYGKIRALTAQTKMSANILACMPFVMVAMLFLVRPDYPAPLWETEGGRMLAVFSVVMIIFGYIACRRLGMVRV
jgi:tight adherence protein B